MHELCSQCDASIVFNTKELVWYECGRLIHINGECGFTCDHRKTKTRCLGDPGRKPMGSFSDWLRYNESV